MNQVRDWTAVVDQALEVAEGKSDRRGAELLGVSFTTLNRWRATRAAGERIPEPRGDVRETLERLANQFAEAARTAEPRLRDTSYLKPRAQDEYDRLLGSYVRRGWPAEIVERASRELVQAITGASTMRGQGAGRADLSEEDQLLAIGGAARDIEEEYAARWTKR
jgi:hypothetical protein